MTLTRPAFLQPGEGPLGRPAASVGLWGSFDTGAFGDALIPHLLSRELARRLPHAAVRSAAPLGCLRPTSRDGGVPPAALGPWSPGRVAAVAAGLDCVLVAATDLFPDRESLAASYGIDQGGVDELAPDRFFVEGAGDPPGGCRTVWVGVRAGRELTENEAARVRAVGAARGPVTVTDRASRRRLQAAGVTGEIGVIPDLALLAARLHSPELLAKRLDYLRLMGWYPSAGTPLLIEGPAALAPDAHAIVRAIAATRAERPGLDVVVAEMGSPGGAAFAEALTGALAAAGQEGATYHLPAAAGLEDLCAAIAACGVFAGTTTRGALVAASHARPQLLVCWGGAAAAGESFEVMEDESCFVRRPEELGAGLALALARPASPAWLAGQLSALDASLDAVAAAVATSARHREPHPVPDAERVAELEAQLANLTSAHDARSHRLAAERMIFANHLRKAEEEIASLKAEAARAQEEAARAQNRVAQAEVALRAETSLRAAAEAELIALRATRTFRYTAELRTAYGRLRRIGAPPNPEQPHQP
jgi:hypothetical protein